MALLIFFVFSKVVFSSRAYFSRFWWVEFALFLFLAQFWVPCKLLLFSLFICNSSLLLLITIDCSIKLTSQKYINSTWIHIKHNNYQSLIKINNQTMKPVITFVNRMTNIFRKSPAAIIEGRDMNLERHIDKKYMIDRLKKREELWFQAKIAQED